MFNRQLEKLAVQIAIVFLWESNKAYGISLTTKARVRKIDASALHAFVATPANWPKIVASSFAVEGTVTDRPMRKGDSVKEVFGLPPLIPLSVEWTTDEADVKTGYLDVVSPEGLRGVAADARMQFFISQDPQCDDTDITLVMSYTPLSPLASLAVPVLMLDNALALNVLLPAAVPSRKVPIDEFRDLMGSLYGFAGLAHALDLAVGQSTLLTTFGCPSFSELPATGKALAVIWCAMGPFAATAARAGFADIGLVAYGMVEVVCAAAVAFTYGTSNPDAQGALVNAAAVQALVAASWVYSHSRVEEDPGLHQ